MIFVLSLTRKVCKKVRVMKKIVVFALCLLLGTLLGRTAYAVTQTGVATVIVKNGAYIQLESNHNIRTSTHSTFFQTQYFSSQNRIEIMY
jgi:hypothetical protein